MCNVFWIGDKKSIYAPSGGFVPFEIELKSREIYPNYPAPIFKTMGDDFEVLTWGLPPPPKIARPITNIRNLESYFWRGLLDNPENRCLVPVSRFAEWYGAKGQMQKAWFGLINNDSMFAGIWRENRFAFLTTEPNELIKPFHPKSMPVILKPENYETWINGNYETAIRLQRSYDANLMQVFN